jgi:outer membrane protein assembly factor BamB
VGLADAWPAAGPPRLWTRALGEGHSTIVVDGDRLYTMYRPLGLMSVVRRSQEEVVLAADAATGKTVWEHRFPSPTAGYDLEYGAGPHVTPLVVGDRIFAVGSAKQLFALDKRSGKVLWSHDLMKAFASPLSDRGYSSSPLAYKDTIILPVGGPGQAVMAFGQQDGKVRWKQHSFMASPASPLLIELGGEPQLVVFGGEEVFGLNPDGGAILWRHPHKTEWGLNISTPVFGPDGALFISSAYSGGSRLLQLARSGGAASVKELWFTNRMRVHFGTAIRIGDVYYGSSGDFGPAFFAGVDARTGSVLFQDRSLSRASMVYADGKLVLLDEEGVLAIARADRAGLKVLSRASILASPAWTAPTLVGTTMYVRDRATMAAYSLGR